MLNPKKDLSADYSSAAGPDRLSRLPLKIGLVFDDSLDSVDGVAQQVKTFGKWLSAQGHDVRYLVGETKLKKWAGGEVYSLARNQKVVFNANCLSIPLPANRRRIREVLKAEKFAVLHVQMPHSPFMAGKVIKAAGKDCAVIGTFHILPSSWLSKLGSRFLRLLYGHSLKRFDKFFSVSPPAADFAQRTYGIKSDILPNVVDVQKFKVKVKPRRSGKRIVFLGRLVKRKGCLELLRAFNILLRSSPEVSLTIAGDGPLKARLASYVRRHHLNQAVTFSGFVEEEDKAQVLSDADIACFPSLYGESFGVVLVEAMAVGAGVVIGGDNPGYASVLGERAESLVDPNDTTAFAARLERLINDQEMADDLHHWQQSIVGKYDVEYVGPKLVSTYRQAIAKRLSSRHN